MQGLVVSHFEELGQTGSSRGGEEDCNAGAKIFWVTVTVDSKAKTFLAYIGDVAVLSSPKRIPMHPTRHVCGYKCLTKDEPDDEILNGLEQRGGDRESMISHSGLEYAVTIMI